MRWYYVSNTRFTVAVAVEDHHIVDGPPIIRARWIGRSLDRLIRTWRADRVERV